MVRLPVAIKKKGGGGASPLIKSYHSFNKGIGIFSRRYGTMHVGGDAVASAKLG
jgi:hypothetical protein